MRMWSYSSSVIRIINTSATIQPYAPAGTCNATERVHFRNRIGVAGFELIFKMSDVARQKSQ